jgi:hypothetical protein
MAYPEDYEITKVQWKKYLGILDDAYETIWNQMKDRYKKDEAALQAACATVFIPFINAANGNLPGIVTWDDKDSHENAEFKVFATLKPRENKSGGYSKPSGGYNKPSGGGNYKKNYNNDKPLEGEATQKQLDWVNKFLNDKQNAKVQKIAVDMLAEADVASAEELSRQQASDIMQACFDELNKTKGKK